MSIDPLVILVISSFFGGMVTGIAGFGSGPLMMAVWLQVIEPKIAAPLLMLSALFYLPTSLRTVWHAVDLRRIAPFIVGAALGVPIGVWILSFLTAENLKLGIGIFLVLYGLMRLVFHKTPAWRPLTRTPDVVAGVIGGIVSGAAAIRGVVWAVWCGLRGWTKDEQRAVYQPLNIFTVIFTVVGLAVSGLVTREVFVYALWCIPSALVGVACGVPLYRRISETMFQAAILLMLVVMGVLLVAGHVFEFS